MTEAELDAYLTRARPGYATMTPAQQALIKQQYSAQQSIQGQAPSATGQAAQVGTAVAVNQGANAAMGTSGVTGGGVGGGMSTGTGGGMSMAGSSGAPAAMGATPLYVPAAALAGTYLAGKSIKNTLEGKEDNSTQGKIGRAQAAFSTGGLSEVAKFAGIGGGKNKDQQARDNIRSNLQQGGFIDGDYNLTLSDGTKFNIGQDGSTKAYNVNFNDPIAGQVVAMAAPLADLMAKGNDKLSSDFAGYLTNAALSNAGGDINKAKANIMAFYQQSGVSKEFMNKRIDEITAIDKQKGDIYRAHANQMNLPSEAQSQDPNNMAAQADQLAKIRAATSGFISKLNASSSAAQRQAVQENAAMQEKQRKSQMLNGLLNQATQKASTPIAFPTPTQSSTPTNPGAAFSGALNNILRGG